MPKLKINSCHFGLEWKWGQYLCKSRDGRLEITLLIELLALRMQGRQGCWHRVGSHQPIPQTKMKASTHPRRLKDAQKNSRLKPALYT